MRTTNSLGNRIVALALSIIMVLGMVPSSAFAVDNTTAYGTVESLTDGVAINGTGAEVKATYGGTLNWIAKDESVGRNSDGWWVGLKITAPDTLKMETAKYTSGGQEKLFKDYNDSEDTADVQWMGLWGLVKEDYLRSANQTDGLSTYTWTFDWDGNGVFEQTVVLDIEAARTILLNNTDEQVYPAASIGNGTVAGITDGASISANGNSTTVTYGNITLNWDAADPAAGRNQDGWWVGMKITAPAELTEEADFTNVTYQSYGADGWSAAKSFWNAQDSDKAVTDTARYLTMWGLVTPELIANDNDNVLTYQYRFDWNSDGIYEQTLIMKVDATTVKLMKNGIQQLPLQYGVAESITQGSVSGSETANSVITFENITLNWDEANPTAGRNQDGWWVGAKITAPAGMTTEAVCGNIKYQRYENGAWSEAKSFWSAQDSDKNAADTARYLTMWCLVTPELIANDNDGILTLQYRFDWNQDGEYEQQLTTKVDASKVTLLNENNVQVYPTLGVVTPLTNGTVTGSGTGETSVLIKDVTIAWSEKNEEIGRGQDGWWTGIKVTAPSGADLENIKYRRKTSEGWTEAMAYAPDDGTNDTMQLWGLVTADYLDTFISYGRNMNYTWQFDWNNDGTFEQTVTMSVDPTNITLKQAGFDFSVDADTITYGDNNNVYTILAPTGGQAGTLAYSISDPTVATLNDDGTLTILKAGTVEITATLSGEHYENITAAYTLTVEKADQPDFGFDNPPDTVTWQEELWGALALKNGLGTGALTWSVKGNSDVATVDPNTGKITLLKAGTFTLQVQKAGNDCYNASAVGETEIEVLRKDQSNFGFGDTETVTVTYNDNNNQYTLVATGGQSSKDIVYTIVSGDAATVDEVTGIVTILMSGTVVIKATKPADDQYNEISDTYKLTIEKDEQDYSLSKTGTISLTYGTLSYANELIKGTYVSTAKKPVYSISQNSIGAGIDAETGKVTFSDSEGKVGKATVTVTVAEDDFYKEFTASYEIDVSYLAAPNVACTLSGTKATPDSTSDWFVKDLKIEAPEGYEISFDNELISTTDWDEAQPYAEPGETTAKVYLKRIADGAITDAISVAVKYDDTAPEDLKIDYKSSFTQLVLQKIFMLTNSNMTVEFSAKDTDSGIAMVEYSLDKGETFTSLEAKNGVYSVVIKAEMKNHVALRVTNGAGTVAEMLVDEKVLVIDKTSPVIGAAFSGEYTSKNGILYTKDDDFAITFRVDDANFSDIMNQEKDGTKKSLPVVTVNGTVVEDLNWSDVSGHGEAVLPLPDEGDYEIVVTASDRLNNADSYEVVVHVDKTAPSIKPVVFTSGEVKNSTADGRDYYNAFQTATIVVEEHSFNAASVQITITANGREVPASDYIKTDWNSNADKHTLVLEFAEDANYTLDVAYTDIPGNVADDYTADLFTVDTTKPDDQAMSIEYKTLWWPDFLNNVFGFAQDSVEVTVSASDVTAGIKSLSYSCNGIDFTTIEVDSYTFTIPAQYEGQIILRATDYSDWTTEYKDGKTVIVDKISPEVQISYDTTNRKDQIKADNGIIASDRQTMETSTEQTRFVYNGNITATLRVDETYFYSNQVKIIATRDGVELAEKTEITTDGYCGSAWTEVEQGGKKYQVKTLTLSGDGDYVITVEYSDESHNGMNWSTDEHTGKDKTRYVSNIHTIDTKAPEVTVTYTDKDTNVANTNYHSEDREATITIKDRNFRPNEFELKVVAKDVNGNTVQAFDYDGLKLNQWNDGTKAVWKEIGADTWQTQVTIPFSVDANYTVSVAYMDLATNNATINAYETAFTVDHVAPEDFVVTYSENALDKVLEAITFGYHEATRVVTLTATDKVAGVEYFTVSAQAKDPQIATSIELPEALVIAVEKTQSGLAARFVSGNAGFLTEESVEVFYANRNDASAVSVCFAVPEQFRGEISFNATDMGHLTSGNAVTDKVLVVDTIAPTRKVTYTPTNVVDKTTMKDTAASLEENSNVVLYYNKDAVATFEIKEANFYKEDVKVFVNGKEVTFDKTDWASGAAEDVWTNTLTIKEEGDYVITMTYTDRSSNEMVEYESQRIVIDKTAPVIDVKYANTDVKNTIGGRDYLDQAQTVTITVKDHNFRPDDVVVKVTAKDVLDKDLQATIGTDSSIVKSYAETAAARTSWYKTNETDWRRADDTYVLTLKFDNEANYTFDIEYQDMAKNAAADYTEKLFTVDTTAPKNLTVDYSTSVFEQIKESITFGYYNAMMTVTITAEDDTSGIYHFAYSYIKGKDVSGVNAELLDQAIKEAETTYDGKKATATFNIPKMVLGADNQFNGTVEFNAFDRSEVSTELKDSTVIVVDNITPTSKITYNAPVQTANGISYYDGDINATIVVTEANFDAKDVVVTVTKDGENIPINVSWKDDSVDTHTGTFTLTKDGDYIVSVQYKDKSGNQMTSYKSNELTLDATKPTIKVSNIKANSANKDEKYGFVITINDTNLDASSLKPVLKAVVQKEEGVYVTMDIDLGNAKTVVNGQTYTYTVEDLPDDGFYTLTCEVKDMSANGMSQIVLDDGESYDQVQFSINRNGSAFGYGDKFTEELVGQYYIYSVDEDVVIVEVNVDPIEEYKVSLNGKELTEGTDYTTTQTSKDGEWSKRTYTIKKDLFEAEGEYSIIVTSTDKAATTAFSDVKNLSLAFVVDQTKPVLTITGLEAGGRYQTDAQTVTLIPTDEGGRLNNLSVVVLDSNGNPLKDDNGTDISVRFKMAGEELLKYLEENDGKVTFTVPEGLNNQVKIICNDCAVNADDLTNEYNELFERVTVSQNQFVIFYANTPLFVGTIVGVLAVAGLIVFLIKRKGGKKNKTAAKA